MPPAAAVTDNFNRANENPVAGIWAGAAKLVSGHGALEVSSNELKGFTSGDNSAYVSTPVGPDCEAFITVATKPADTGYFRIFLRAADVNGTGALDGYSLEVYPAVGTDEWYLTRWDNGASTDIASQTAEIASGDAVWFELIGSALKGYQWDGASWTQRISATDGTYTGAGYAGFYCRGGTGRFDSWGHGTISAPAWTTGRLLRGVA